MQNGSTLVYKIASEAREFEQIHELNYRTFVEEIPQHSPNARQRLVDRLHHENTYVVCLDGARLAGMVALRAKRPFSLDEKLSNLDSYLPPERVPCEVRLLAVAPEFRKSAVFSGLVHHLAQAAIARGCNLALISGTTRELKLYAHLGFEAFGPLVGEPGALYQPMMLTLERFLARSTPVSFLPGPVEMCSEARRAFAAPALSHRSARFGAELRELKAKLRSVSRAAHLSVLLGSGTLANDVIGAQLSLRTGRGLVAANGEFGERLIDHARRWRLAFDVYREPWAEALDPAELARRLQRRPAWLWLAHCETSTGMLNDLAATAALCRENGVALAVDAVSSIGALEVDLSQADFASAVSGKALGGYPGLAVVFHRLAAEPSGALPRYLDLGLYAAEDEVPFTHSSNLVAALCAALERVGPAHYQRLRQRAALLRDTLAQLGWRCVVAAAQAAPGIVTVALPGELSAQKIAMRLARQGHALAWASGYLQRRNWLQIALMGQTTDSQFDALLAALSNKPFAAALNAVSGTSTSSVGVATRARRASESGAFSCDSISMGRARS
jgi:aspartate aminotransferase-like enzyme/GNAT superfamily N-acetyltransferase